jgi:Zn-dependent alcohol dehydrogenase
MIRTAFVIRLAASLPALCAVLISGCATASQPVSGLLYSDVQSGLAVSSNQVGNRVGESCASSVLGLVAMGDASIEEARRAGGITEIVSVDSHTKNYAFFYAKHCTVVRGR